MSKEALFPVDYSTYTDGNGQQFEVPCTIPGIGPGVVDIICPDPFLPPTNEGDIRNCIKPCPVNAYTFEEYDTMWLTSASVSTVGLLLNLYMAATWYCVKPVVDAQPIATSHHSFESSLPLVKTRAIGGSKNFRGIRMCVVYGLAYGLIDTLPMVRLF
jgi:hypothetical protein